MPDASTSPLFPDADLDELLALARTRYEVEFETISAGGVTLDILQIANMREILDKSIAEGNLSDALETLPLWAKIWPASLILGHMLRHIPPEGHSLLEVGAGCGVAGLVAAGLGFPSVCITDVHEDALLFARINILKNNLQGRAFARRVDLRADNLDKRFSLIIGSEILYMNHLYGPLARFLKRHILPAASRPEPQVLLASDHRRDVRPFFQRAEKDFHAAHRHIGARAGDSGDSRAERHLLVLHKLTPLS